MLPPPQQHSGTFHANSIIFAMFLPAAMMQSPQIVLKPRRCRRFQAAKSSMTMTAKRTSYPDFSGVLPSGCSLMTGGVRLLGMAAMRMIVTTEHHT
jgi:hypothetical protein